MCIRDSSYAVKDVENLYPNIFIPFVNKNPISRIWRKYNCDFVPFQTGTYTQALNGITYQEGPQEYCVRLWNRLMTKIRGFELVSTYTNQDLLPKRETAHAAGYDLKVAERTVIAPGEIVLVPTGVKAYMQAGEVLYLYDRSSNPRKKGLVLINSVGVIDGDYYGNPGNEGHIFAQMKNITDQPVTLEVGERIVQGVFMPFLIVDGDEADGVRTGGFGSTGK